MTGVQEPQSASSALEAWVQTRLAGNLDDWNIEGPDAERVSFRGQSGFTFAWEEARSRTDMASLYPCRRLCKNPANKMECLMGFGDSDGPPIGTEDKYR